MSKYKRIKISLAVMMSLSTVFTPQAFAVEHVFHRGFNGILYGNGWKAYGGENSLSSIYLVANRSDSSKNAKFLEIDSRSDGKGTGWAMNPTHLGKVTEPFFNGSAEKVYFDPWDNTKDRCNSRIQNNCLINTLDSWARYPGHLTRHFLPKRSRASNDFIILNENLQQTRTLVLYALLQPSLKTIFIDVKGWSAIVDTVNNLDSLGLTTAQKNRIVFEIEPRDINPNLPVSPIRGGANLAHDVRVAAWEAMAVADSLSGWSGYHFLINAPDQGAIDKLYIKAMNLHPENKSGPRKARSDIAKWVYEGSLGIGLGYKRFPLFWGWNMLSRYDYSDFHDFSQFLKYHIHTQGGNPYANTGLFIMEWKPGYEAFIKYSDEQGGINRDGHCCYTLDARGTTPDSKRTHVTHLTYDEPDGQF